MRNLLRRLGGRVSGRREAAVSARRKPAGQRGPRYLLGAGVAGVLVAGVAAGFSGAAPLRAVSGTTFTVTRTDDRDASCSPGDCSLREAIKAANASSGLDTITFAIALTTFGIQPTSSLPVITDPVVIDGSTEPGFSGSPIVQINGAAAGSGAIGLEVSAGGSTIRDLLINGFATQPPTFGGNAIYLHGGGSNVIEGNYLGPDSSGNAAFSNIAGLYIFNSANNQIGGTSAAERNVISGNLGPGIAIQGLSATQNAIIGNYMGTTVDGTAPLANGGSGVDLDAPSTIIGGTTSGAGNVISGNGGTGIQMLGDASGTLIEGNKIGTNAAGTAQVANYTTGVLLQTSGNTVGGTSSSARNLISGNRRAGIQIFADGNSVQGNYIGTDATGTSAIGNGIGTGNAGVAIQGSNNTIGGADTGAGNVLSGNTHGVWITGASSTGNVVQGNSIGTSADGTSGIANYNGVLINAGANGNRIGGTGSGEGNRIAFNSTAGAEVESGSGNRILGDSIFSNGALGIDLDPAGVTANDSGDSDTGPNGLQNFPVLTSVSGTTVDGTLNSAPNTAYRVELFASPSCDSSGHGQGKTFLGSRDVTTDGSGDGSFSFTATSGLSPGDAVTATATDPGGSTSEFSSCQAEAVGQPTFTVNSTADTDDGACTTSNCTLREAINAANAHAGTDTISFAIPGSGIHTIQPSSQLPTISDPAVLDGTTEPGFVSCAAGPVIELDGTNEVFANQVRDGITVSAGSSTVRGLVINNFAFPGRAIVLTGNGNDVVQCNYVGTNAAGSAAAGNWVGVAILSGAGDTIGGTTVDARNVISGNAESGIRVDGASGATIQGNYIGTNAAGNAGLGTALGQNANGILLNGASNASIGGTAAAAGNLISGNGGFGVAMNSTDSTVQGNYIGVTADGQSAVANTGGGIYLGDGTTGNLIGGTSSAARNVIAGNGGFGVYSNGAGSASSGNLIQGNYIGTDAAGIGALGNASGGIGMVEASFGSRRQTVGGTTAGAENIIAHNGGPGVSITGTDSTSDPIEQNSIFSNAGLGIDLGGGGVTANDTGDGDSGPNNLQNFPALSSATPAGVVQGTLNSTPNNSYRLEFFSSPTCDQAGNGEGQTYLGALPAVPTDGSGNSATFTFTANGPLTSGDVVTATATDPNGNTSEFSACQQVAATASVEVVKHLSPAADSGRFDLAIDATSFTNSGAGYGNNGTTGPQTVATGSHTVSETAHTGSNLSGYTTSYACTRNGGAAFTSGSGSGIPAFTANANDTIVCTFTNTHATARIELRKALTPAGDPGRFNLFVKDASGTTVASASNVGNNGTTGATTVPNGTYSLSETAGTGTSLASYVMTGPTCVNRTGGGPVPVNAGAVTLATNADVICTISNRRASADLAVSKTASVSTAEVGKTITYTITVRNNGPDPVQSFSVSDSIPAGTTFVSASDSGSGTTTVSWTIAGPLASGGSKQLTLVVRVNFDSSWCTAALRLSNTASITASTPTDPVAANNNTVPLVTPILNIPGTSGADTLIGGPANEVILGGGGQDTLKGGGGDDILCGGNGQDTIVGDAGNDILDGQAGEDTASYADYRASGANPAWPGSATGWSIDLSTGNAHELDNGSETDQLLEIEDAIGTDVTTQPAGGRAYNDLITGDAGANVLTALAGDDLVHGGAGDDTLDGGAGDDTLDGGAGDDQLFGDMGNDTMSGGPDNDRMAGGSSTAWDDPTGNAGNNSDVMNGNDGNDLLLGQAGDDTLEGGKGTDRLNGGNGADQVDGGGPTVTGGPPPLNTINNVLYGGGGSSDACSLGPIQSEPTRFDRGDIRDPSCESASGNDGRQGKSLKATWNGSAYVYTQLTMVPGNVFNWNTFLTSPPL